MFGLIAAFTQAGGIIIDKFTLTRKQVELRVFIPLLFLFLFLLTAVFFPFLGKISVKILEPQYLILFGVMIVTAIIWNVFYYRGAQAEKVHEFEAIVMFQPLITIILASIFLKSEQSIYVVITSVVASIALVVAHIKKEHFEMSIDSWGLVLAVVLMSFELIAIDLLLKVISPVALYCVRTGILFIFFWFYYKPKVGRVANSNIWLIFATSALGVVQMVTKFYGFESSGVVFTSLILILAPVLTYLYSAIFFHEGFKLRQTLSFGIILVCVIFASLAGK